MSLSFAHFPLHPALLKSLAALNLTQPTPVQQHAIPLVLEGRDAIVQAKTGSGKTLAFGLPLLTLLQPRSKPQALVMLPTRELALQVCEAVDNVGRGTGLRTLALYGGVGLGPQEAALRRGADLIVATPGRLKDLHARGSLDLSGIRILVLDEADEMLDMGFRRDIEYVLDRLPAREQTLILSATMPEAMETIARKHLKSPAIVKLTETDKGTPSEISHHFVRLGTEQRLGGLIALLRQEAPERAIVFTRMKHETKRIAQKLERHAGLMAGYLNGNMSQNARNTMLERFRSGELRYLIATDVAARGLHVDGLSHVIHYAVPTVVETYIHRSGRTGRAGNSGKTIILVTPDAEADFKAICRQVECREIPAASLGIEPLATVAEPPTARPVGNHRGQANQTAASGERRRDGGRPQNGRGQGRKQEPTQAAKPARPQPAAKAPQTAKPAQRQSERPQAAANGLKGSGMADLWGQAYPERGRRR